MNTKKLSELSIIFMGAVLIVFLLERFSSFLRPLTLALLLSLLFTPLFRVSKKERWVKIGKIFLFILLTISFVVFLSNNLIIQISDFQQHSKVTQGGVKDLLQDLSLNMGGVTFSMQTFISTEQLKNIVGSIISLVAESITSFASEFFLILIFLIFILPAQNIWVAHATRNMKKKQRTQFLQTFYEIEKGIREYLKTKTIISLGTAILSFIVLLLFKVPYSLFFATLIFSLNFIPNIGSIIAVGLVLLVALFSFGLGWYLFWLAILLIFIQVVFGNIIEPKFTGRRLDLSPLIVLISLFFWGALWGVSGMLFSVPLTLVIKILLKNNKSTKDLVVFIS